LSENKPRIQSIVNNLKEENRKTLPSLKIDQQRFIRKIGSLTKEKEGLLKWMSQKAAKPYTLNVLNERFEKIELELNDLTHSRWQVEEELKKRLHFGLSSEKVSLYLKNIVETFARLDWQEKKRALMEVIQKIKVNSSNEVHLSVNLPQNFPLPYKAKGFGEILLNGALRMKNTRKAVFQISYPIKDYYNNNGSSMK
jgi:hypothetical protein